MKLNRKIYEDRPVHFSEKDSRITWIELDGDACRQYIDVRSAFTAWEDALRRRKRERAAALSRTLVRHQRMNWALYVGQAPRLLVIILHKLFKAGHSRHMLVIGSCSLYAYEAEAAVAMLFCDPVPSDRNHLILLTENKVFCSQIIEIVKKADKTFAGEQAMLINSKGFVVEVKVGTLDNIEKFSSIVVAKSGHMARMNTVDPSFAAVSGFDEDLLQILLELPLLCNLRKNQQINEVD